MEQHTQIQAPVARVLVRGLEEMGATASLQSFNDAVRWPCESVNTGELFMTPVEDYEIVVTPEVVSAALKVLNGGDLTCYIGSGVTSEQLLKLVRDWQDALSIPTKDSTQDGI
jgi:hypothetical protein